MEDVTTTHTPPAGSVAPSASSAPSVPSVPSAQDAAFAPDAAPDAAPEQPFHDTLLGNPRQQASQEAAEQHFALLRAQVEQDQQQQWAGMVKEWRSALEQDAEIGGAYLQRNVPKAQLALHRFDPDGTISTWLGTSGYGNHPDVLRFLLRISDAMGEDSVTSGNSGGRRASLEDRMYGNWQP